MAELNFSLEKTYWKEEVPVDVTSTTEPQTVTPEAGHAFNKVNVGAIPPEYVVPSGTENITANGDYNIADKASAHVAVEPSLDSTTVIPTKQQQTVEPQTGYDGLGEVIVEPIPDEYVIPTGSVNITQNGTVPVAGKATANVNVPGIIPTGTKQISITENGTTTEDVTDYADAEITVNTDPIKGVVYGNYDSDGFPNSARFVGEWKSIPPYYFWDFARADGTSSSYGKKITTFAIPETVETVGASAFINNTSIVNFGTLEHISEIGNSAFNYCTHFGPSLRLKDNVILGNGSNLGHCFKECYALKSVTFLGNVIAIPSLCFDYCRNIELYDFSHCTAIPNLFNTGALYHKSGCVIRIPAALSDTTLGEGNGWESATNWSALTNIVWEVV